MKLYKFGSKVLSLEEIKDVGRRHGREGTAFLPPSKWSDGQVNCSIANKAYRYGYAIGKRERRRMKQLEEITPLSDAEVCCSLDFSALQDLSEKDDE